MVTLFESGGRHFILLDSFVHCIGRDVAEGWQYLIQPFCPCSTIRHQYSHKDAITMPPPQPELEHVGIKLPKAFMDYLTDEVGSIIYLDQ